MKNVSTSGARKNWDGPAPGMMGARRVTHWFDLTTSEVAAGSYHMLVLGAKQADLVMTALCHDWCWYQAVRGRGWIILMDGSSVSFCWFSGGDGVLSQPLPLC